MEYPNRFDSIREHGVDTRDNVLLRSDGEGVAFFGARHGNVNLLAHISQPADTFVTGGEEIDIVVVPRVSFAPGFKALPLGIEDDLVGLAPSGGIAAETRRQVFADQPSPLRGAPFVVVEDATVVEEDHGGLHASRWHVSLRESI